MRAQPDGGGPAARAVEGALGRRQGEEAPLLLRHGLPGEYVQGDPSPRVIGSAAVNLGSSLSYGPILLLAIAQAGFISYSINVTHNMHI